MLPVRGSPRFVADGDELAIHRLALTGVAGIDIAGRKMPVVFGQQLALLKADVPFLGECFDGEDVTVVNLRAPRLPVHTRIAVLCDANAVAFADGEL